MVVAGQQISKFEFVALMASMTSVMPLAIDSMLPAFPEIGKSFNVQSPDQLQMIIAILFLGFGFGQLIFGPLSDVFGRKPPIYWGLFIFVAGSILSGLAHTFELFILGRFLQGFGGAAPRIISLALIRDEYSGEGMAQITSLVMTIFILVPAIAPTLGQGILYFWNWNAIFIVLFVVGLLVALWFGFRQHETLPKERCRSFSLNQFMYGVRQSFSHKITIVCMVLSGLLFGIFVGYLGAVQDIFATIFNAKERFPMYFGILALSIGAASFYNSRLVMRLGMVRLIISAFITMAVLSCAFAFFMMVLRMANPPLWLFMVYMTLNFFTIGFLFGNLNALAMQPLGHIAGMGSAMLGFVQSTISVAVGIFLGQFFHTSVFPLVLSFAAVSIICLIILKLSKVSQIRIASSAH